MSRLNIPPTPHQLSEKYNFKCMFKHLISFGKEIRVVWGEFSAFK